MSECDKVALFWDGELTQEQAHAFQDHLSGCRACQVELDAFAQLDALGQRYIQLRSRKKPRWRRLLNWLF